MNVKQSLVSVVDDDESVRESLPDLLRAFGLSVQTFASAAEFLRSETVNSTNCLILDIAMPNMTGPQLQRELAWRGSATPIIFITGLKNEPMRLQLIAEGAVDCLYKPFSDAALQQALNLALGVS